MSGPRNTEPQANGALARALSRRNPDWNDRTVHAERTHVIHQALQAMQALPGTDTGKRPDILVASPRRQPVIVETEFAPARTVEQDATAGSMRFLRDMLQRFSRQVLTAGKADETVADANGPRPGHSIFTGHLLDALEGGATREGVITASGVMEYVYQKVARDQYSRQTPHYGFFDGDGDFVFASDALKEMEDGEKVTDLPMDLPIKVIGSNPAELSSEDAAETLKQLLATPSQQIRLDDFASAHVRAALDATSLERFPVQGASVTNETFALRVTAYEAAIADLATMASEKVWRISGESRGGYGVSAWITPKNHTSLWK